VHGLKSRYRYRPQDFGTGICNIGHLSIGCIVSSYRQHGYRFGHIVISTIAVFGQNIGTGRISNL